jgi:oligosaccharide repeat unit polymerase
MVTGKLFDPYVLFFIAALLFNGGQALLEVLGLNERGILGGVFPPEIVLQTLFLIILGLGSVQLGALLAAAAVRRSPAERVPEAHDAPSRTRDVRLVGWGLIVVAAVPALLMLREAVATVMAHGYFALFQREAATGFAAWPRILAGFLMPGALFLLAGSKGRAWSLAVSGVIVLAYVATQFFLGARAPAALVLVAYVWLWDRCIRRLPRAGLLGAGATLLFVVFPLVRLIRSVSGAHRLSLSFLSEAFLSMRSPFVAILTEMGGSMKTVAYTIQLVPHVRGYDAGLSYLYALFTIVPNFFWDIHPAQARGTAADWLVRTVDPRYAALGGGYGFSFIGEAYLNFGWFGAPVALALIGFLFAKLVLWADRSGDPARLALLASFMGFFLFYTRAESATVVRPLLWYSILPWLSVGAVRFARAGTAPLKVENQDPGVGQATGGSGASG